MASKLMLRRAVLTVAALNLGYFAIESSVALLIDSVALLADSIDFLEDASVNLLIALALLLSWTPLQRARLGQFLALLLLAPALATLWMAWHKFQAPHPPDALLLGSVGFGALLVNSTCAVLLARVRRQGGSLTRAAWLSARNDALANVAIIIAAPVTRATGSGWPDLLVGLAIAALNADAAKEVWQAARQEERRAQA